MSEKRNVTVDTWLLQVRRVDNRGFGCVHRALCLVEQRFVRFHEGVADGSTSDLELVPDPDNTLHPNLKP